MHNYTSCPSVVCYGTCVPVTAARFEIVVFRPDSGTAIRLDRPEFLGTIEEE